MLKKLLSPDEARQAAANKFANWRGEWLLGEGSWPLSFPLGTLTQQEMAGDVAGVGRWIERWRAWDSPGTRVEWALRSWPALGRHELPARVLFDSAVAVAQCAGAGLAWELACLRHRRIVSLWPQLTQHGLLKNCYELLTTYSEEDFERLLALLQWLEANPNSGHYLRQLPVKGLDTKWAGDRRGTLVDFLLAIRGQETARDFYAICGLTRPAHRVRLRVLCPELRSRVGGLHDIEAPLSEVAGLQLSPKALVVVENQETGLALPDFPGCVAFMKLGLAVGVLAQVPWLQGVRARYWGDIDTHGYAILSRARQALPQLESVLMDEPTVIAYRELGGREPQQFPHTELPWLTPQERYVVEGLYADRWGAQMRIEQERLPWEHCSMVLRQALG